MNSLASPKLGVAKPTLPGLDDGFGAFEDFFWGGDADAGGLGDVERAVFGLNGGIKPFAVGFGAFFVFLPCGDLSGAGGEVEEVHEAEPAGEMRHCG